MCGIQLKVNLRIHHYHNKNTRQFPAPPRRRLTLQPLLVVLHDLQSHHEDDPRTVVEEAVQDPNGGLEGRGIVG